MRSWRLTWKIWLALALLELLVCLGTQAALHGWLRSVVRQSEQQRLLAAAVTQRLRFAVPLPSPGDDRLQRQLHQLANATQLRWTLVAGDGTVLGDSAEDPRRMESHAGRPEILDAGGDAGWGTAERRSATIGESLLYVAVPILDARRRVATLRVAVPLDQLDAQQRQWSHTVLGMLLLAWLAAAGLTYAVLSRWLQPLERLTSAAQRIAGDDGAPRDRHAARDEIASLTQALNRVQASQAERLQQLQAYSDRLAIVLGSMAEGVVAVDRHGTVLFANDASRTLLGFAVPEPIGRPLIETTRCQPVHDGTLETLRTGLPQELEFEVPGSTRRVVALRTATLPGEPSRGVVIVLRDVSNLRRLENLRQEFVANVSHELKTPLASIKAYAETLRLGAISDPEHNQQFVVRIEEQADRLHQLILDLLHLARIESGQQALEISDVHVQSVVAACVAQYSAAAQTGQITLVAELPPDPVVARAEEEGLSTILNNLIDNALKYTPSGGSVTVRVQCQGPLASIEVQDTGIGIARKDMQRVFERFYRVDKARSREMGGTGLGLSIVKHLTQALGGRVSLESDVGRGSTFRIELRRAGP